MKIYQYSLGQLQANCYFVVNEKNCLIIDPGDEAPFILEEIHKKKLNPVAILATHGHFDHLMAVGEIQQSFNIPLYISEKDNFLLSNLNQSAEYFLNYKPIILPILKINNFKERNYLKIKNFKFKIIFTPGHTPGSVCFYFPGDNILFTGDTLFKRGIGRYDFSYSNKNQLIKSLGTIFRLHLKTKILPGHGEGSTLEKEKDFICQNFLV
ncbi:MAG: MBL fold metallo-hydrolase [Microgenomates group bacterium]